jgi:hypothetical protein
VEEASVDGGAVSVERRLHADDVSHVGSLARGREAAHGAVSRVLRSGGLIG